MLYKGADVSFWVQNADGFAFRFTTKVQRASVWAEIRKQAIGSIDSDRGWCRYIDPAIDLHIVPVSPDVTSEMIDHIYEAMSRLDMPSDRIDIFHKPDKKNNATKHVKLHSPDIAKPECATTKIHLLTIVDISNFPTRLVKASSTDRRLRAPLSFVPC